MAVFYSWSGLKHGGTYFVNSSTVTAIASDPKQFVGKAVAVTGNNEVGYGTAGNPVFGIVISVEKESTNSNKLVCAVDFSGSFEDVPCAGSETAGTYLAVDGQGGVQASGTSAAPVYLGAIATAVDATEKTCTMVVR